MISDEFNRLAYAAKMESLQHATLLADRLDERYYVELYNLYNFYVEVFHDDRSHIITKFRAFEHTLFVLPYVSDLKIAV